MMQMYGNGEPLVIAGAGAHGLVVADAARAAGWAVVGFLDDGRTAGEEVLPGAMVLAEGAVSPGSAGVVVAIGDNAARRRVFDELVARGHRMVAVVHPSAVVSEWAELGAGVYVGARAVVNPEAVVERGVVINTAAVVEHHNHIGAFAFVSPGAVLAGHVVVGAEAMVGARAVVRPGQRIGARAKVGAGAVVVRDVMEDETAVGLVK